MFQARAEQVPDVVEDKQTERRAMPGLFRSEVAHGGYGGARSRIRFVGGLPPHDELLVQLASGKGWYGVGGGRITLVRSSERPLSERAAADRGLRARSRANVIARGAGNGGCVARAVAGAGPCARCDEYRRARKRLGI